MWLSQRPLQLRQIRCTSVHGGLLSEWVKYNQNYFYLCPFWELTYRSDPSTDFYAWWLKRRGLAQACAFFGICSHGSPFSKPPKPQFWGVNRRFQAKLAKSKNVHIIKTTASIPAKFLHSDKDHQIGEGDGQMPFVGGPNTHITNPRQRTANILEKSNKSSYLGNGLNDRHEIWHGYANIRYDTVDLRALKSWRDGQLYLAHGQKRKIRNK